MSATQTAPSATPPLPWRIELATPCRADWNQMTGDDRARFCQSCQKNVYNLSVMTQAEAQQLVREKEGQLCVRFFRRPDGTVLTADCPVGRDMLRPTGVLRMPLQWLGSGAVLFLAPLFTLAAAFGAIKVREDAASGVLMESSFMGVQPFKLLDGLIHPVVMGGPPAMTGNLVMPAPKPTPAKKARPAAPSQRRL